MAVTTEYLGRAEGNTNSATAEYPVTSGDTVYDGEAVYLSGGRVTSASIAGKRILGFVVGGDTQNLKRSYSGSATGNAGGTVKVLVNIERDARYLMKADNVGTTLAVTHEGTYFDLVGNPGSQLVDSSTTLATSGQLVLIKFNPGIRGTGSTYGIFRIAENQHTNDDIGVS
jgi:hypothetical protein